MSEKNPALARYYAHDKMVGCTQPAQAALMSFFLQQMHEAGTAGDVMEIGVYRGMSAILFSLYLGNRRKLHLVDPGIHGNVRATIEEHLLALNPDLKLEERVLFDDRFSQHLKRDTTIHNRQQYGFIHVDGGHAVADVYRDLESAADLLTDDGIVICDDFFGTGRPDVTEGVYRYLRERPTVFRILVTGHHKAVLCRVDAYSKWWIRIVKDMPDYMEANHRPTQLHLYGSPVEFPTIGLVDRAPNQPTYAGYFLTDAAQEFVAVMSKAIGLTDK